uniref:Uncharacterized protein n=1 Tax=Caudovirales sp. ct2A51 TaxID=2827630 RepID=A0A8S5SZD2_9CAUD|nr:MAG TPA: hypothetical protein [Caudovirales sp. ct2A51]
MRDAFTDKISIHNTIPPLPSVEDFLYPLVE